MDPLPDHPRLSLLDPQLLWATFALIATLLLGALVFAWLDRWRKRPTAGVLTPAEELAAFRSSYERGELSQEEYGRIRARLAPKLRQQLDLPATGARCAARGDEPKPDSEPKNDGDAPSPPADP
jgi:hypothetical protein